MIFLWGLAAYVHGHDDWRLQILEEQGISSKTPALEKFLQSIAIPVQDLDLTIKQLGSENFDEREKAQKKLKLLGVKILPLLGKFKNNDDPEVTERLNVIIRQLENGNRWVKNALVRRAATSLIHERKKPGEINPDGTLFVEFFSNPNATLENGYHKLVFSGDNGMDGFIANGVAQMKGNRAGGGDQRLLLLSKNLTGKAVFPDNFRIETKIGGKDGGVGAYHVGVSIGNVRALFHPGYNNGGFRYERVDNNKYIIDNTGMGFTPKCGEMLTMSIDVKRMNNGDATMQVKITSGKNVFRDTQKIKSEDIGKIASIGLDRSGRTGGNALFDDFIVDLGKP